MNSPRSLSSRPRRSRRHFRARAAAHGFSLLEVLVSLLIFSFGILGAVGLQARTVQLSVQAGDRTRAALLANEIVSQMWLAKSTSLGTAVVTAWNARVADASVAGLPSGAGTISDPDANGVRTITITWHPPSVPSTQPDNKYVTQVVMP